MIVSATFSAVETLKYTSFHGICSFNEIFSFFNLVNDFFSKWNFSKNRFPVLISRHWFISIFDIRNCKSYFFNTDIYFDNNFHPIKFIYLFLLQNLNNFISFITPVVERWLILVKRLVDAPAFLVLSCVLFMIDRTTAQVEKVKKMASYSGMAVFLNNIYVSGPIFVKLANDFNRSYSSPTFAKK